MNFSSLALGKTLLPYFNKRTLSPAQQTQGVPTLLIIRNSMNTFRGKAKNKKQEYVPFSVVASSLLIENVPISF